MSGARRKRGEAGDESGQDDSDAISGMLNLFGIQIDLGKLLDDPEEVTQRLDALRERLKQAGGKETVSDEEWRQGATTVSGFIRTRGQLGKHEYHVGTVGRPEAGGTRHRTARREKPRSEEVAEPPIDVFDEGDELVIVADVPGLDVDDLDIELTPRQFSLTTKPRARRAYRKVLPLEAEIDPQRVTTSCHNGVLELRARKQIRQGDQA